MKHVIPEHSDQLKFLLLEERPGGPVTGLRAQYTTCGVTYKAERPMRLAGLSPPEADAMTKGVARQVGEDVRRQVILHNIQQLREDCRRRERRLKKKRK